MGFVDDGCEVRGRRLFLAWRLNTYEGRENEGWAKKWTLGARSGKG